MKHAPKATTEEWLAAWEKAFEASGEAGVTTQEVAERLGISHRGASGRIQGAVRRGELEFAGKKRGTKVTGTPYWIPVYRLIPPKK